MRSVFAFIEILHREHDAGSAGQSVDLGATVPQPRQELVCQPAHQDARRRRGGSDARAAHTFGDRVDQRQPGA